MKSLSLLYSMLGGLLLAMSVPAFAQKIKKESMKIAYLQLPLHPISKEIKTFYPIIDSKVPFSTGKALTIINKQKIRTQAEAEQDYLSLEKLERVSTDADLTIVLTIGSIKLIASSIGSGTDSYNKKKIYYEDLTYNLPATLKVTDKNKVVIMDEVISAPEKMNAVRIGSDGSSGTRSITYQSPKELKQGVDDYFSTTALYEVLHASSLKIAELAPKTVSHKYMFYSVEYKKYAYTDLHQAQQYALQALTMMNSKSDSSEIKETFQKALVIWDKAILEADLTNDRARVNEKIHKMLHFNCALASMLMGDFRRAKHYAEVAKDYKAPVPFFHSMEDEEDIQTPILEQIRDFEARQRANRY